MNQLCSRHSEYTSNTTGRPLAKPVSFQYKLAEVMAGT